MTDSLIPTAQVYSFWVGEPDRDKHRPYRIIGEPDECVTVRRTCSFTEDTWRIEQTLPGWHSSHPYYLTRGALHSKGGFWMTRRVINRGIIEFTLEEAIVAANNAITRYMPYSR